MKEFINVPEVRVGLVAVSRDCFPEELSRTRRIRVAEACHRRELSVVELQTLVENETDALAVLEEIDREGVNALVVFLGNFGPEGPATLLAQRFDGPVMFAAAAEETGKDLIGGRGDAYCGLLSACYNLGLRSVPVHLPEYPVGNAEEVAGMIEEFIPVARVVLGVRALKIFTFGPRPHDFFACNAPIQPLFDLGVEVMENSELDLYDLYLAAEGDADIDGVHAEMAAELGTGNEYPEILPKLAQFEVALIRFMEENLGASRFGIFANKCWPSFEKYFGFVPCFVNSRLAARGIPVACEVDIYGALSEYMGSCATMMPVTLLDINNTVPARQYSGKLPRRPDDEIPAHHAPAHGTRFRSRHHAWYAGGPDQTGRDYALSPAVDGARRNDGLYRRGGSTRHAHQLIRRDRGLRHSGDGQVLPARVAGETLPPSCRGRLPACRACPLLGPADARSG